MQIAFEQPVKLFFLWLGMQVMVTVYWWVKRNPQSFKAVWICLVLLPVLEAVCFFVVTPREQIQRRCHELAIFVQKNDVNAIAETIEESFEASGYDKDELVLRIEDTVTKYSVTDIQLQRIEVQFPTDQQNATKKTAVAEFDATAMIQSAEMQYEPILSRWRLTFIRRQTNDQKNDWKVTHIKVLPRPLSPVRSLRQCLK